MIDEFQLQDQLSFLNESSPQLNPKIHDSFYPQAVDAVELVVRKLETNPLLLWRMEQWKWKPTLWTGQRGDTVSLQT